MPDTAIARVEALAVADGQPLLQASGLVIEWRPDHPIDKDEYDHDYVPPAQPPAPDVFVPGDDFDPLDADETHDLLQDAALHGLYVAPQPHVLAADQGAHDMAPNDDPWIFNNKHAIIKDSNNDNNSNSEIDDNNNGENNNNHAHKDDDNNDNEDHGDDNEVANEAHYDNPNDEYNEGAHDAPHDNNENNSNDEGANDASTNKHNDEHHQRYDLRPRHPAPRFHDAMDNPHSSKLYYPPHTQLSQWGTTTNKHIFGYVMTQMTAKAGIKKHGEAAVAALMKEFAQLEDLGVYEAVDATLLTQQERKAALRAINLIKEKRDGKLKGRTVADGSVQRSLYDKSETASPTVSPDALLLSIIIDAHEGRDVATADIAGAYLKADMDDFVLMKFTGESVNVLCELNHKHLPFVVVEKGGKVLYVKLIKAIYGCVKSALLWYKVFHSSLKEMGFTLNPYDPCVANCTSHKRETMHDSMVRRQHEDITCGPGGCNNDDKQARGTFWEDDGNARYGAYFPRHEYHVYGQTHCSDQHEELLAGSD
jgi:Reverse transcriptase (RNA-dependent DNA polymerase)